MALLSRNDKIMMTDFWGQEGLAKPKARNDCHKGGSRPDSPPYPELCLLVWDMVLVAYLDIIYEGVEMIFVKWEISQAGEVYRNLYLIVYPPVCGLQLQEGYYAVLQM